MMILHNFNTKVSYELLYLYIKSIIHFVYRSIIVVMSSFRVEINLYVHTCVRVFETTYFFLCGFIIVITRKIKGI